MNRDPDRLGLTGALPCRIEWYVKGHFAGSVACRSRVEALTVARKMNEQDGRGIRAVVVF